MKRTSSVTIVITAFLASTCFISTRADRTDLTAALPSAGVGRPSAHGEPLFDTIRRAYAGMDLPIRQRTWDRLVREAITLNGGLVQSPDLVEPRNPAANHVAEGTELQVPAVIAVREGDKGIGRVLLRLRPELKKDRRALLRAIRATIAANADVIGNADVDQLVDGDYNVIQVGDLLVIPEDVMPAMSAPPAEATPVMVAEIPEALEPEPDVAEVPVVTLIDKPVDDEDQAAPAAVVEVERPVVVEPAHMPVPPELIPAEELALFGIIGSEASGPVFTVDATMPLAPALPAPELVETAEPVIKEPAVMAEAEPPVAEEPATMPVPPGMVPVEQTSLAGIIDTAAAEPVFTAAATMPLAPALTAPEPTETPEPVIEEPTIAAVVEEPVAEETAVVAEVAEPVIEEPAVAAVIEEPVVEQPLTMAEVAEPVSEPAEPAKPEQPMPFSAVTSVQPSGPIGLTARETRVFGEQEKEVSKLTGTHLMLAYLAAGLAAFGFLVLLVLRWLERDKAFRAQISLLIGVSIFLITFGKVKKLPAVDWKDGEEDSAALPETEAKQEN